MRQSRPTLILLLPLLAAPLAAQNPECAGLSAGQNARQNCDAAVDLTRAYHPIAGLLVSGGNPVLGSQSTMGGLGHFAISFRANAAKVAIPELAVDGSNNVAQSDRILAPMPVIEGALGLFKGMRGGLLALDVLASVQAVPNEKAVDEIRVDPDAMRIGPVSLSIGYGARVGILNGEGGLPGLAVSVMRRSVPRVGFGDIAGGDDLAADLDLHATNIRLVAGKRFAVFTLAAGAGWSKYTGDVAAAFRNDDTGLPESITLHLDQSRAVIFADAGLDLKVLKIVGEIGHQSGKDQHLITNFEGFDDTKGTTFFSAGLRFGF